jgi:CRISPR-associated protein Csm4
LGNDYFSVHWYFLCQINLSEEEETLFWKVWASLIKTGIGGERSTGAGQIENLTKEQNLPEFFLQAGSQKMALSLIFPNENEQAHLHLYQSKLRGGMFLGADYRLKVAQAVLEGAVHKGLQGQIHTLHQQDIDGIRLRYGLDFSIALPEKYLFKEQKS